jgi:predicted DNA-binding antitoxin AbrB/MazE fold protein
MVWQVDAIVDKGVLRPVRPLPLADKARVRITIEPVAETTNGLHTDAERERAMTELLDRLARSPFRSEGPYPTRDELHER